MGPNTTSAVTRLLAQARQGDAGASEQLLPLVYDELRVLAAAVFNGQAAHHTLQPTALVHEAWLKLAGGLGGIEDRPHFFAVAGKAMRQVLIDYARGKGREKRGGGRRAITLATDLAPTSPTFDLIAFDDALRRLAALNPRHAEVAELRLLGALTVAEAADMLGVSQSTVDSDWAMAKAWLRMELVG